MTDLDAKRLGDILKGKRLMLGLSLDDVSTQVGVTRGTLAGYERGARSPGGKTMLRLQIVLSLEAEQLVGA